MLHWEGQMPLESRLIQEVAWLAQDALLVKEIDRSGRVGKAVLFQYGESEGKTVRTLGKDGEEGEGGWIKQVSIGPCPSSCSNQARVKA